MKSAWRVRREWFIPCSLVFCTVVVLPTLLRAASPPTRDALLFWQKKSMVLRVSCVVVHVGIVEPAAALQLLLLSKRAAVTKVVLRDPFCPHGRPILQSLDVDYVLVIFGGVTGYSSDDINKFLWPVRIGSGVFPDDMHHEKVRIKTPIVDTESTQALTPLAHLDPTRRTLLCPSSRVLIGSTYQVHLSGACLCTSLLLIRWATTAAHTHSLRTSACIDRLHFLRGFHASRRS